MLRNRTVRPPNLTTAYWLIENPGTERSEVFTVSVDAEMEALPVFSFPDEAEMFLRLGGFEEEGWRTVGSTAGELVSRLSEYRRAGVDLIALDPLPEMVSSVCDTTIALVTLSLSGFAERHAPGTRDRLARG
jgi:hypothetical protein